MKIQDAVIEFKDTGSITIDVDKIIKNWNLLWRIYQTKSEYTLVSLTPKGKVAFKAQICKRDAERIIKTLSLDFIEDTTFNNSGKWLL